MSDRERSRSPDRGDPPADTEKDQPPAAGDDKAPAAPQDAGGDSAPVSNNGDGAGAGGGDEVKLYVGNLDYGMSMLRFWIAFGLLPERKL